MGRWSRKLAPLLVDLAAPREPARVLDAGCGTGNLSFTVARMYPQCRVEGLDPSPEYIRHASAQNPFPGRVRFRTGDAQRMEFAAGEFDACLSLLVLNFIPDPDRALREILRVTRAGGCVAAAVWDYGTGMRMLRVFWDAVLEVDPRERGADESRMRFSREGELEESWRRLGLVHVRARPLEIDCRFESFDDFWQPFLLGQGAAGAYLARQDERRREALRKATLRRLELAGEDRPFSLPARAWAARGEIAAV